MEPTTPIAGRRWKKRHLLLLTGLTAGAGAAVLLALHFDLRAAVNTVILALREAGPVVFFGAMALLPAAGFPLMAFTLAAGPVFGPTLGTAGVIGWSLTAVFANLLLTYWLANRALRPLAGRLLDWFGFPLPAGPVGSAWQLTLIARLTPGLPFWLQSYVLGLVRVPLVPYLVVSLSVMAGYIVAIVAGGEAVVSGNGRLAFAAAGVLVVSVAVLQLLRRRTARRVTAAAARD